MNNNFEKPENVSSEEKADNKPEEIKEDSGISIFVGFLVGIALTIYAIVSGRLDLLEAFSDIDNYMGQYVTIMLVMTKITGAGCCGIGSQLYINSYTGGIQEDRTKGIMWFLTGLIMLALKTLVSTPIPPIQ